MADCVGGVLCFDALCFSGDKRHGSPKITPTNYSTESLKVNTLLCTHTHTYTHAFNTHSVSVTHTPLFSASYLFISVCLWALSDIIHVCLDKHFTSCLVFRSRNTPALQNPPSEMSPCPVFIHRKLSFRFMRELHLWQFNKSAVTLKTHKRITRMLP